MKSFLRTDRIRDRCVRYIIVKIADCNYGYILRFYSYVCFGVTINGSKYSYGTYRLSLEMKNKWWSKFDLPQINGWSKSTFDYAKI